LGLCASATSNPPDSVDEFRAIPGSAEAVCEGQNAAGTELTVVTIAWTKKNVLVLLGGSGLALPTAEALAKKQNAAIPASGVRVTSN
jgi:hypothetical protein